MRMETAVILIQKAITLYGWKFERECNTVIAFNKNGIIRKFNYEWEFVEWLSESF